MYKYLIIFDEVVFELKKQNKTTTMKMISYLHRWNFIPALKSYIKYSENFSVCEIKYELIKVLSFDFLVFRRGKC